MHRSIHFMSVVCFSLRISSRSFYCLRLSFFFSQCIPKCYIAAAYTSSIFVCVRLAYFVSSTEAYYPCMFTNYYIKDEKKGGERTTFVCNENESWMRRMLHSINTLASSIVAVDNDALKYFCFSLSWSYFLYLFLPAIELPLYLFLCSWCSALFSLNVPKVLRFSSGPRRRENMRTIFLFEILRKFFLCLPMLLLLLISR